jgi:lipid-binding SYLF domain-containing protein
MRIVVLVLTAALLVGCKATFGPSGDTPEERRDVVLTERDAAVRMIVKGRPEVEETMKTAPGYAFFSNANLHLFLLSSENGYGVITTKDGQNHYVRSLGSGAGIGWGIKEFRAIIIFKTQNALNTFIDEGITPRLNADISAIYEDEGGSISRALSPADHEMYQITESGLALQATFQLSMFWYDDLLNESKASR